MLGVVLGREVRAYPFAVGATESAINDELAGTPLLIAFGADGVTGLAYDRRVDGQTLSFELAPDGSGLVDAETGSTWNLLMGVATTGPLVDSQLQRVRATRSFWFGWSDFYTQTTVYGLPSS